MKNVVITPEGKSVKANHPAASEKVFSLRWLGGETEHFLAGDQTDAYTDEHGTTYGRSIKGSWIPVGKEGRDWEWVRYNPPRCNPPRDFGEEEAFRAAEGGYEPVPSFKAVWNDEEQDGFVFGEEFDADEHRDRQGRTTYYGWPGGGAYPVEIERSSFKMGKVKKNGRHSVATPDRWYVVYHDTGEVRGPMRHTAAKRISNKANLEEGRDSSAASEMIVKRDYSHAYYRPANAKPNGFKHARPFGGSVGREQYHVHFEDAKGIIYYYAGNTDRGVKLEREYGKAKKFTAAKAASLAKRLDRLYKNVRHDGGHFYAESAGDVKANGKADREEYFEFGTGRRVVISAINRKDLESDYGFRVDTDEVSPEVWSIFERNGGKTDPKKVDLPRMRARAKQAGIKIKETKRGFEWATRNGDEGFWGNEYGALVDALLSNVKANGRKTGYDAGYEAYGLDKKREENPYHYQRQNGLHDQWDAGWLAAQRANLDMLTQ